MRLYKNTPLLASFLLVLPLSCAAAHPRGDVTAAEDITDQEVFVASKSTKDYITPTFDDDDEPMVWSTPSDYKGRAIAERERMLAEGVDPDMVMLQSELFSRYSCGKCAGGERGGEFEEATTLDEDSGSKCAADTAQRLIEAWDELRDRGVTVLNDMSIGDSTPQGYGLPDGVTKLDLRRAGGVTKGEFREIMEWWQEQWGDELWDEDLIRSEPPARSKIDVPEKWKKYEVEDWESEL